MTNTGTPPRAELIDLRFRNGSVVRSTSPKLWRWSIGDSRYPANWDYDIQSWRQVA